MVGGEKQKQILKKNKSEIEKLVLSDLRKLIKCQGNLQESNFYLWENGIPQYNLFQDVIEESVSQFHSRNKGFFLIGNYFAGVSVSDCIKKAHLLISKEFN